MIFDHKEILLEKYVGKTPELKLIEKELDVIVGKIAKKNRPINSLVMSGDSFNFGDMMTGAEISDSPENKKIEKLFQKMFDLKYFSLKWTNDPTPNAFTVMPMVPIIHAPTTKRDDMNVHKNNKMSVNVWIQVGLVTKLQMTPGEILAIILHEIGHNFYHSIWHTLSIIPFTIGDLLDERILKSRLKSEAFKRYSFAVLRQFALIDIFGVNTRVSKLFDKLNKELKDDEFYKYINKVAYAYRDVTFDAMLFSQYLTMIKKNLEFVKGFFVKAEKVRKQTVSIASMFKAISIRDIATYNVEKHADSFAIDYGYGPELGTGMTKLQGMITGSQIIDTGMDLMAKAGTDTKSLTIIKDFLDLQILIMDSIFYGYPSTQNRIRNVIDRSRHGLKDKNLDPRLRKELQEQLDEYEDFYFNKFLNIQADENKHKIFTVTYMRMVEVIFKGKMDPRELTRFLDIRRHM